MKNLARVFIVVLLIISIACPAFAAETAFLSRSGKSDFRGLWVSTVVNIDYPVKPTTDPETLKRKP